MNDIQKRLTEKRLHRRQLQTLPCTLDGVKACISGIYEPQAIIYVPCSKPLVSTKLDWFSVEVILTNRRGEFFTDGSNNVSLDSFVVEPFED